MPHTPGNWKLGKNADTVVSDFPHNHHGYDREDKEYYGGYLIAESIGTDDDRELIAAAPSMKQDLNKLAEVIARNLTAWDTSKDKSQGLLPEVYLTNKCWYKKLTGEEYSFSKAVKKFNIE